MKAHAPVLCSKSHIGTKSQTLWRRRGSDTSKGGKNSGPSGWKTRPAARMQRALAEMAASNRRGKGIVREKNQRT